MTPNEISKYMPTSNLLHNRIILVTGACEGIGKAVAKAYAAHGATVILLSEALPRLETVYDEICQAGYPEPAIYPMSLEGAIARDYDDLCARLLEEFGHLDGLVNNAAQVGGLTPLRNYDVQQWGRMLTINLHAPFMLSRACIPLLEQSDDPAMLFSTHHCLSAYWGAYGVAKHAMLGMLTILADELNNDTPVRVNGIDSGPVRTNLLKRNYPGTDPDTWPSAEIAIPAYLYFMGPDSKGTTGVNLLLQDTA